MKSIVFIIMLAVCILVSASGYEATHSLWSYGVTFPLCLITGYIARMIVEDL